MKRRKKIMSLANKKIIFISLIISMSVIGVGYAEWNDTTTINLSTKTGYILKDFINNSCGQFLYNENGEFIKYCVKKDTLFIKGTIYSKFNQEFEIFLDDTGTVPSSIIKKDIKEDNKDNKYISKIKHIKDDSFVLNIHPINDNSGKELNLNIDDLSIDSLSNEINDYNAEKKYEIYYEIPYELEDTRWKKNLYIVGCIEVIPNPDVKGEMLLKLEELKILEEEKQKALEEQLRAAEEQKLQEESSLELENTDTNLSDDSQENNSNIIETEVPDNEVDNENMEVIKESDDSMPKDETTDVKSEEITSEYQNNISDINNDVEENLQGSEEIENINNDLTGESQENSSTSTGTEISENKPEKTIIDQNNTSDINNNVEEVENGEEENLTIESNN